MKTAGRPSAGAGVICSSSVSSCRWPSSSVGVPEQARTGGRGVGTGRTASLPEEGPAGSARLAPDHEPAVQRGLRQRGTAALAVGGGGCEQQVGVGAAVREAVQRGQRGRSRPGGGLSGEVER